MASEKTLALRELEQSLKPRHEIKSAGPTSLEALQTQGKVISTNRATRLKAERIGLTRKQRNEIRESRKIRKFDGIEPEQPAWAQEPEAPAPTLDLSTRKKLTDGIVNGGTLCMPYAAYLELGGAPIEGGAPHGVCIRDGEVTRLEPGSDEQEGEYGG